MNRTTRHLDGDRAAKAGFFGLGWACADEGHFAAIPQAVAAIVHSPRTHVQIARDGQVLMERTYRTDADAAPEGTGHTADPLTARVDLGLSYTLTISAALPHDAPAESHAHQEAFHLAVSLIREALECILVRQHDRHTLGGAFRELSDREWAVCVALQTPAGEKQIAHDLACSRHTVHSYVKGIYRKMRVRSRLLVLEHLRKAREQCRAAAVQSFSEAAVAAGRLRNGSSHSISP
jgi:hypothetical protein